MHDKNIWRALFRLNIYFKILW